jgi:hypothetical protein
VQKGAAGTVLFSSGTVCSVVHFPSLRKSGHENNFHSISTDTKHGFLL